MRIWIDLSNSPHVLFMRPIVDLLRARGAQVEVTARDFAQTLELCERHGLEHTAIGRHRGGRVAAKAMGLLTRSAALARWARRRPRFDLALSHGSNDLTLAARRLGIPVTVALDYEWATVQQTLNCRLAEAVVAPDAIPAARLHRRGARGKLHPYPGLKEEYYLADFEPDPSAVGDLGLHPERPFVVSRPPPDVALYHRFENPRFAAALEWLRARRVPTVVLPRTAAQRAELSAEGGAVVPERALDAQSLMAFAALVISAGGTMNREAVALGTPSCTVFEGRLGGVDERLLAEGRLHRLTAADDLDRLLAAGERRPRVRRDPAALLDLLLAPLPGAPGVRLQGQPAAAVDA